jgi:hypothetical protein
MEVRKRASETCNVLRHTGEVVEVGVPHKLAGEICTRGKHMSDKAHGVYERSFLEANEPRRMMVTAMRP